MSEIITVPGNIPGLRRRSAPLIIGQSRAVAVDPWNDGVMRVCFDDCMSSLPLQPLASPILSAIDLSEPAGRDIAARWMAERLGMEVGLTAPSFYYDPLDEVWVLAVGSSSGFDYAYFRGDEFCSRSTARHIHGLPMGRVHGIEAMRLCVLHLAGRQA